MTKTMIAAPDGRPLTLADLPAPGTRRWVIRRKAEVVGAVSNGLLSLDEACTRYRLSVEESMGWQRLIDRHGLPGQRTTKTQHYRCTGLMPRHDLNGRLDGRITIERC